MKISIKKLLALGIIIVSINAYATDNYDHTWNDYDKKTKPNTYGGKECDPNSAYDKHQKDENNGHGNGDQDAPGNSLFNNNAENANGGINFDKKEFKGHEVKFKD